MTAHSRSISSSCKLTRWSERPKVSSRCASASCWTTSWAAARRRGASIRYDGGREFHADVKRLLTARGIVPSPASPGVKTSVAVVERFNRTIRELIERYKSTLSSNWLQAIPRIQKVYNERPLTVLNDRAPSQISEQDANLIRQQARESPRAQAYAKLLNTFRDGDQVRVREEKATLGRRVGVWSKDVHTVELGGGVRVRLDNGETVSPRDLLKVKDVQERTPVSVGISEAARKKNVKRQKLLREIDAVKPSREAAALGEAKIERKRSKPFRFRAED